jgi:hypothetical protein
MRAEPPWRLEQAGKKKIFTVLKKDLNEPGAGSYMVVEERLIPYFQRTYAES